jgi:hypothetical protein
MNRDDGVCVIMNRKTNAIPIQSDESILLEPRTKFARITAPVCELLKVFVCERLYASRPV